MAAVTDAGIDPRWTGMCSAYTRRSPAGGNRAAEQAARSLMFALDAPRRDPPADREAGVRAATATATGPGPGPGGHLGARLVGQRTEGIDEAAVISRCGPCMHEVGLAGRGEKPHGRQHAGSRRNYDSGHA